MIDRSFAQAKSHPPLAKRPPGDRTSSVDVSQGLSFLPEPSDELFSPTIGSMSLWAGAFNDREGQSAAI